MEEEKKEEYKECFRCKNLTKIIKGLKEGPEECKWFKQFKKLLENDVLFRNGIRLHKAGQL